MPRGPCGLPRGLIASITAPHYYPKYEAWAIEFFLWWIPLKSYPIKITGLQVRLVLAAGLGWAHTFPSSHPPMLSPLLIKICQLANSSSKRKQISNICCPYIYAFSYKKMMKCHKAEKFHQFDQMIAGRLCCCLQVMVTILKFPEEQFRRYIVNKNNS